MDPRYPPIQDQQQSRYAQDNGIPGDLEASLDSRGGDTSFNSLYSQLETAQYQPAWENGGNISFESNTGQTFFPANSQTDFQQRQQQQQQQRQVSVYQQDSHTHPSYEQLSSQFSFQPEVQQPYLSQHLPDYPPLQPLQQLQSHPQLQQSGSPLIQPPQQQFAYEAQSSAPYDQHYPQDFQARSPQPFRTNASPIHFEIGQPHSSFIAHEAGLNVSNFDYRSNSTFSQLEVPRTVNPHAIQHQISDAPSPSALTPKVIRDVLGQLQSNYDTSSESQQSISERSESLTGEGTATLAASNPPGPPPTKSVIPPRPRLPSRAPQLPPGRLVGNFYIVDDEAVSKIGVLRPLPGAPYAYISSSPIEAQVVQSSIPKYKPRISSNELLRLQRQQERDGVKTFTVKPRAQVKKEKHERKIQAQTTGKKPRAPRKIVRISASLDSPRLTEDSADESSETDSDNYSTSDDSDLEIVDEISPLPAGKPEDPAGAIEYETIRSVWRPARRILSADEIRRSLADFWGVIKPIREEWLALDKQATEKKGDAVFRKKRIVQLRDLLGAIVRTAIKHGHWDVIAHAGDIGVFVSLLFSKIIRDRIKADDVKGPLMIDGLELLSRCTHISEETMEKLSFEKVSAKLLKMGDERIKALVETIKANVTAHKRRQEVDARMKKEVAVELTALKGEATDGVVSRPALGGVKRPRAEADVGTQPPGKRLTPGAGLSSSADVTSGGPKSLSSSDKQAVARTSMRPQGSTPTSATDPTHTAKPKTSHITTKPTSFFQGLAAASKIKPAATAPKPSVAKITAEKKAATPTVAPAAARPAFSLFDTLNKISQGAEPEASSSLVDQRPLETAEEKKKRLRKEERRKLRVTWKPDHSLCAIRIFAHDQAEEGGWAGNLVLDAGDAMSEGQMFKQHKENSLVDEDEDRLDREESLRTWVDPVGVDFEVIAPAERVKNAVTRGGQLPTESAERVLQSEREANTLMAFYPDEESIPPSPREPSVPDEFEPADTIQLGSPPPKFKERIARLESDRFAASKEQERASFPAPSAPNISAILNALTGQQQPRRPGQQPVPPKPLTDLEKIFANFSGVTKSQDAVPAVAMPPQPLPIFPIAPPIAPTPDLSSILAAFLPAAAPNHAMQPFSFQPTAAPLPTPAIPAGVPDIQAILAQLGRQQQPQQQQQSAPPYQVPLTYPSVQQPPSQQYGGYLSVQQPASQQYGGYPPTHVHPNGVAYAHHPRSGPVEGPGMNYDDQAEAYGGEWGDEGGTDGYNAGGAEPDTSHWSGGGQRGGKKRNKHRKKNRGGAGASGGAGFPNQA